MLYIRSFRFANFLTVLCILHGLVCNMKSSKYGRHVAEVDAKRIWPFSDVVIFRDNNLCKEVMFLSAFVCLFDC